MVQCARCLSCMQLFQVWTLALHMAPWALPGVINSVETGVNLEHHCPPQRSKCKKHSTMHSSQVIINVSIMTLLNVTLSSIIPGPCVKMNCTHKDICEWSRLSYNIIKFVPFSMYGNRDIINPLGYRLPIFSSNKFRHHPEHLLAFQIHQFLPIQHYGCLSTPWPPWPLFQTTTREIALKIISSVSTLFFNV